MVTGQPNGILVYTNHKNDTWRTKEEELKMRIAKCA
jgi:catechol-2,3-dioxygenase